MKRFLPLFLLIPTSLMGQEPDSSSAVFGFREAERSFAKASAAYGRQEAFAEFFAPDFCVVFTDKWVTDGKELWKKRKASPMILKWEPEYMDISGSLDFGVSTGPWEAQEYRPGTKPVGYGCFLSVWQKQKEGSWKVILDAGINTPGPGLVDHKFNFADDDDKDADSMKTPTDLTAFDNALLKAWKSDPSKGTFNVYHTKNLLMLLDGHFPSSDTDSVNKWVDNVCKKLLFFPSGGKTAPSDDLGFTWGMTGNTLGLNGHYVRIWKKDKEGDWKISIEVISVN